MSAASSLSSQLKSLKLSQTALKIAPNQEQPSLLFDKFTARNTSVDTIYSMALLSYQKLAKELSNNLEQTQLREELLSESYKDLNRNGLTKVENEHLSKKLGRFMVELSSLLLNSDCQHVLEYLLRNFKVNVFEAELLGLVFMQYWNFEIYKKIISNISHKQMTGNLSFLNQMSSAEEINFSFIVKTLAFSHATLDRLVALVLQSSLLEISSSKDEVIDLGFGQTESESFVKHPLKNFLMKIFLHLIKEAKVSHYRYVIDFCASCLRIKSSENAKDSEIVAMVLTLLANLIFVNGVSSQFLSSCLRKLIRKAEISDIVAKNVFDFVMIVWQRKAQAIDITFIEKLSQSQKFKQYFGNFSSSKYMIFHHLFHSVCQGSKCGSLLEAIGTTIKNQQFYRLYEEQYLHSLFTIYLKAETQGSQNLLWVRNFLKENFKWQLGRWVNKQRQHSEVQKYCLHIFDSTEISGSTGLVELKNIQKVQPATKPVKVAHCKISQKLSQMKEETKIASQSESAEQGQEKGKQKNTGGQKKLVEFLRSKGIHCEQIDFKSEETKQTLIDLFYESYSSGPKSERISAQQKNLILEKIKIDMDYSPKMLRQDLEEKQYSIPIKFMLQMQNSSEVSEKEKQLIFDFADTVFEEIHGRKQLLEDIVFRELLRLIINQLCALAELCYKQVTVLVSKHYKKLIAGCQSTSEQVQVSALMLKLSEKLFAQTGNSKGKYQNIIHSHCKLLSVLINAFQNHSYDPSEGQTITEELLKTSYRAIIKIFGVKETYLINTGVIELLSRKELSYKSLKYFIDHIMTSELNYENQTSKQSPLKLNFYQHALSVGRSLVLSSYMFGVHNEEWIATIDKVLTSGIAKNQITVFYGLIKDKLKRNIARKIFLFLKLTYQSKKFVSGFKTSLESLSAAELTKTLHVYSQIYYIMLSIAIEDAKIQSAIQKMLDQITNLFSLDLRLRLFEPLLPNRRLYGYLTEQLEAHAEANYDELSRLINVAPDQLSMEWVGLTRECLKRGHTISPQTLEQIFTNEHFLNDEDNFIIFSELVCYLAEYDQTSILPYINQSMNIIMAVCTTSENQDYSLALLYRVVVQLKELLDPFVFDIFKYALENPSEFVQKFITDTVQHLSVPTLIDTVKKLSKSCKHLFNFCLFFRAVCQKGVGHLLCKTLQSFCSKTIHMALQDEQDLKVLYEQEAVIFLEMALKFNQNELRKVLIDFIRWAETKETQESDIPFNMRKVVTTAIYHKLSENLGHLFTPFFGYVFESYLKDLDTISSRPAASIRGGKRSRESVSTTQFEDKTVLLYVSNILLSLNSLFSQDTEREFMDGSKFDALSEQLSSLFTCSSLSLQSYETLTKEYLSPCLLTLCVYLKDDYQLKTLNLKILLLLRQRVGRQQETIFNFMDKLIDEIQDRYLLFINDLVPFLIDNIQNRNEKVKLPIKSIIAKVEEMSGTKIENYVK